MAHIHLPHGSHAALVAQGQLCNLATLAQLILRVALFDELNGHAKHLRGGGLIDFAVGAENLKPPLLTGQPGDDTGLNGGKVRINEDMAIRGHKGRADELAESIGHRAVDGTQGIQLAAPHQITGKVKGGLTVMTNGIRAFLPGSLVDTRPVKDTTPYEGKTMDFKVIKLDRKRNNVVVSRRAVVEASMGEERAKLMDTLKEGAIVKGIVKNITDYGAFVDLGGVDGLLHITDLAWRRVRHPSEVVQVGQELEAKVLKFDQDKNRVSLGLKQLGEDPWIGIARRYPKGTRLFGKVTNITDYGAFVEIEAGIEGLVHVSEMDWTNKNVDPKKVVQLGDDAEVMVLEIDEERRRISLGMKQCKPNPWEEFSQSHKKGDKVSGQIKSITDFGVFIGLPGGIDGLVHLSDLSWTEAGEEAVRKYKKGDELEAVVLAIDTERERISLGIKQMAGDPFTNFTATHEKGSVVTGTVKTVDAKGAVIDLGDETEGYLRASEISSDRVEDATTQLAEGDTVTAQIISIDRKNRSIQLSIKAKDASEAREALDRMNQDATGTTNLGALLKAKLEQK